MSEVIQAELRPVSDEEAGKLAAEFADASWRQMPAYAAAAAHQIGAESDYFAAYIDGVVIGLANVRIKKLPLVGGGIAFVSHGPMTVRKGATFNAETYSAILSALSDHFCGKRGLCLRIETQLGSDAAAEMKQEGLAASGFSSMDGRRYQTFVIDLAPGEEALRKALAGKWRTELNRAERQGLRIVRSTAPEDFDRFAPMLEALEAAKGFSAPQDTAFFRDAAQAAQDGEHIELHLAYAGDEVVAGHIGAYSGDMAVYLLGAANAEGRKLRAAYLLQWAAIRHTIERGMRFYDLGGADEAENPDVFRFKKRMGGELVTNLPIYQKMPGQPRAAIIALAEKAYAMLKGR